jgi:hypothetical protein
MSPSSTTDLAVAKIEHDNLRHNQLGKSQVVRNLEGLLAEARAELQRLRGQCRLPYAPLVFAKSGTSDQEHVVAGLCVSVTSAKHFEIGNHCLKSMVSLALTSRAFIIEVISVVENESQSIVTCPDWIFRNSFTVMGWISWRGS